MHLRVQAANLRPHRYEPGIYFSCCILLKNSASHKYEMGVKYSELFGPVLGAYYFCIECTQIMSEFPLFYLQRFVFIPVCFYWYNSCISSIIFYWYWLCVENSGPYLKYLITLFHSKCRLSPSVWELLFWIDSLL